MKGKKFVITIVLVFFYSLLVRAQHSDDDYVYRDSAVNIEHSVENKIVRLSPGNEKYIYDSLQLNDYAAINDSAEILKNTLDFAYAKNLDSLLKVLQKQEQSEQTNVPTKSSWLEAFFISPVTKVFFWTLACLFIGFIMYRLFFTEGFFQRRTLAASLIVLPDEAEHLSATTDYSKLILQAVINQNYRLAIRYHYLQTLQKLAAKSAIEFAVDKTNYQYVKELFDKPYKNEFARLTLTYEYAWYGGFVTDDILFAAIQTNFKNFNNLV